MIKTNKKIFLLYPYYYPHYKAGGPVQSLLNLANLLNSQARVYIISADRDIDGSLSIEPIKIDEWNDGPNNEKIFYSKRISPWLVIRLLKEIVPDTVLINGIFNVSTTIPGVVTSKWLNYRVIISPRGMLQPWGLQRGKLKKLIFLRVLNLFLRKDEEWHVTDEQEKNDVKRIFGDKCKIHVASNIPRKVIPFKELPFPCGDKKVKLVFLSLINPNKNLHLVIDAVKSFQGKIILDIFGPIANETYWKTCQEKMNGAEMISYRGPTPPWSISDVLTNYHFFILPTEGENFGHAIFDALSSSVPVVISRNTPWKRIDDYGAGFFTDLSLASLQLILQHILNMSPNQYQNCRINAHKYASEFWNSRDYVKEYQFLLNG